MGGAALESLAALPFLLLTNPTEGPQPGVLTCSSVCQVFDGPASLLFSCQCHGGVHEGRGYGDDSTHYG